MKEYWLRGELKKGERPVYIGHVTAECKFYGDDKDIFEKMDQLRKESNMEGLRFSILRDLSDEYRSYPGSYYGADVWLIVKNGYLKKNQKLIRQFQELCKEVWA